MADGPAVTHTLTRSGRVGSLESAKTARETSEVSLRFQKIAVENEIGFYC
jgi:hypothetical protein